MERSKIFNQRFEKTIGNDFTKSSGHVEDMVFFINTVDLANISLQQPLNWIEPRIRTFNILSM